MKEVWRPVVGFEGLFEVSDLGNVRSLDRYVNSGSGRRLQPGQPIRQSINKISGYRYVWMCKEGRHYARAVHRLVLEAFVGPRPKGLQCCHGPRGGQCNELSNLSWGTPKKNSGEDKRRDGAILFGERHQNSKLTSAQVELIRADSRPSGAIAAELGVSAGHTSAIRQGKWRQCG